MMYTAVNSSSAVSTNAEKLSTLPWPYRWSASAGLSATRTERNVITAATRSRMECSASDKTPKLPVRTTRNIFSETSSTAEPTEASAARFFSRVAPSSASEVIGGLYAATLIWPRIEPCLSADHDAAICAELGLLRRLPRLEPEIEMEPQAVGERHQQERERNAEEDPEREASIVGHNSPVGQQKRDQKHGDDDRERQAIGDDHATDVITLLTEERKAAARALWKNFIRPASEQTSLLAVGAAHAERLANDNAKRQGARFVHLGQPDCSSIPQLRHNS